VWGSAIGIAERSVADIQQYVLCDHDTVADAARHNRAYGRQLRSDPKVTLPQRRAGCSWAGSG
jgi:hypothetical protein